MIKILTPRLEICHVLTNLTQEFGWGRPLSFQNSCRCLRVFAIFLVLCRKREQWQFLTVRNPWHRVFMRNSLLVILGQPSYPVTYWITGQHSFLLLVFLFCNILLNFWKAYFVFVLRLQISFSHFLYSYYWGLVFYSQLPSHPFLRFPPVFILCLLSNLICFISFTLALCHTNQCLEDTRGTYIKSHFMFVCPE